MISTEAQEWQKIQQDLKNRVHCSSIFSDISQRMAWHDGLLYKIKKATPKFHKSKVISAYPTVYIVKRIYGNYIVSIQMMSFLFTAS